MAKKRTEPWQAKIGTSALNPLQVIELQEAVRSKKKHVNMQGVWFELRYTAESVQYIPIVGWVPTGFINLSKLLRDE